MKIRHAGIVINNMEKSLNFYRDLLELKVIRDYHEKGIFIDTILGLVGIDLRIAKLVDGNDSMLELLEYNFARQETNEIISGRQIYDIGYSHIAFTVDDIDKTYKDLLKKGIKFNSNPMVSPDGKAKVAFCRDPDGTDIELVQDLA